MLLVEVAVCSALAKQVTGLHIEEKRSRLKLMGYDQQNLAAQMRCAKRTFAPAGQGAAALGTGKPVAEAAGAGVQPTITNI